MALNSYYHSVFTNDDGRLPLPPFPAQTDEAFGSPYLGKTVEKALTELKLNKVAGQDRVESRILKECAIEMAPLLHQIFCKSLEVSEVPEQWKRANIVPIHKKSIMGNFRPVACKVQQKILCSAIMSFLVSNNLINGPSLFGTMEGHGGQQQWR